MNRWDVSNLLSNETISGIMFASETRDQWILYVPFKALQFFKKYFVYRHPYIFNEPKTNAVFKLIQGGKLQAFIKLTRMNPSTNPEVFWIYGAELPNFEVFKLMKRQK